MRATLSVLNSVRNGTAGERVDLPPNSGGYRYTEFRDKTGKVTAVVMTALLESRRDD